MRWRSVFLRRKKQSRQRRVTKAPVKNKARRDLQYKRVKGRKTLPKKQEIDTDKILGKIP